MAVWKAKLYGLVRRNGVLESDHIQVRNIDADSREDARLAAIQEATKYNFENLSIERCDLQGKTRKAKLGSGFDRKSSNRQHMRLSRDDAEAIAVIAASKLVETGS